MGTNLAQIVTVLLLLLSTMQKKRFQGAACGHTGNVIFRFMSTLAAKLYLVVLDLHCDFFICFWVAIFWDEALVLPYQLAGASGLTWEANSLRSHYMKVTSLL